MERYKRVQEIAKIHNAQTNIVQALHAINPDLTYREILNSVIDATENGKNPNGVSRAIKTRLSPRFFRNLGAK